MLTPTGAVNLSVPDARLMSRVYGSLFGGGGLLALSLLALPGLRTPHRGVLLGCAVASLLTGALLTSALGHRVQVGGFYALSTVAIALISACFWLAGVERPGFLMFYMWVCPWAFVFFSRRGAVMQLGLAAIAFGMVLSLHFTTGRAGELGIGRMVSLWLVTAGTLTMVSLIVRWLAVMTRRSAMWLSAAFMQSTVGLVVIALDGTIVSANPAFAALVGRDPKDVEGGSFLALLDPADRADCEVRLREAADQAASGCGDVTKRLIRRDGSRITVSVRPTLVLDEQRTQPMIFAQVRDVSVLEQSELRARAATALAERRAGQQEALAQLGRAALTMPAHPDLCQRAAELVRTTLVVPTATVHQMDRTVSGCVLTAVATSPQGQLRPISLARVESDSTHGSALGTAADALTAPVQLEGRRWGFLSCGRPAGSTAEATAFLHAVSDVLGGALARDRYQTTLAHKTLHDHLTGLPNRDLLLDRIDQALVRARQQERRVCLLVADVDSFKHVNDSHGHAAGDAVLLALAGRLAELTQPDITLARLGSDEFALCFETDAATERDVLALAEQVRQLFVEPVTVGVGEVYLTTSIGVAVAGADDSGGAAELLRKADAAVHRAKDAGRNRIETYDGIVSERATARMRLVGELHRAIGTEQLSLVYQPAYSLGDGRLMSLEALVRFDHPDHGPVSPAEFIPIAEDTGLIVALGEWVLHEAVRQRAVWSAILPPEVRVCINVSPRQLTRPEFAAEVEAILVEHELPAACIGIEITETALAHDVEAAAACISTLKQAGIIVLLDDFGTGYSSLSQLQSFAVDVIKLDRSFVAGVTGNPADSAIARAVVVMAHALGLTVTAEGVETEAQSRVLRDMGCDDVQGFFHSRPLEASLVPLAVERAVVSAAAGGTQWWHRGD